MCYNLDKRDIKINIGHTIGVLLWDSKDCFVLTNNDIAIGWSTCIKNIVLEGYLYRWPVLRFSVLLLHRLYWGKYDVAIQ